MVNGASRSEGGISVDYSPQEPLTSRIRLSELLSNDIRLDAGAFGIHSRRALEKLQASGVGLIPLYGDHGLFRHCADVLRFRQNYVAAEYGVPFISSSDIISMRPDDVNYVSRRLTKGLENLLVRQWDLLISRSGTVGNVTLAGRRLSGSAVSEHAIRLSADRVEDAAYAAAF